MKRVIIGLVLVGFVMGSLQSCKKKNYACYDTVYDSLGNGYASTSGKERKYFSSQAEMVQYQTASGKSCIEIY